MRLLLDTHCWLWSESAPERLAPDVQALLMDRENELLLSAASTWEVALKYALGKLALPEPPATYVPSRMARNALTALPIVPSHTLQAAALPPHHRDPFDRMLVAQAQLEGLTLVTADPQLTAYDVRLLWATPGAP